MLQAPGGAERPPTLRRLNVPRSVQVRVGARVRGCPPDFNNVGVPTALRRNGRWLQVVELLDRYRTDDRWWTAEPIARTYYELLLEDGCAAVVFHDEVTDTWHEQRYG